MNPASTEIAKGVASSDFGLVVGRIMQRFGITKLLVKAQDGAEVGTLALTTATFMGVTLAAVAWGSVPLDVIHRTIHELDGHDLPLGQVYGEWDTEGLRRLDSYRTEISQGLFDAVAEAQDRMAESVARE
jgi:hypothetical protein